MTRPLIDELEMGKKDALENCCVGTRETKMQSPSMMSTPSFSQLFIERIQTHKGQIDRWLSSLEDVEKLPLYSSVDMRDAGFKMAVVDTNLFPAGFNNLCEHGQADAVRLIRPAILRRVADCKNILIVAEEHTRNLWYLENVRILKRIIEESGFEVRIATFLTDEPSFCETMPFIELRTAADLPVQIYCFKRILNNIMAGEEPFDLMILNNDLITGIPDVLKQSQIPTYPSIHAGWHSRFKSHHFCHTWDLIHDFAKIINLDPWFFSCLYTVIDRVNINVGEDRQRLQEAGINLLKRIQQKYEEHHIFDKPYLVIKADAGTYGMGVMTIEDPQEILTLNRKDRNKLYKGKSAQIINRFLIQEGVPTIYSIDQQASEMCLYQIENNLLGSFFRSHAQRGARDVLNAVGMSFHKVCPYPDKFPHCGQAYDQDVFEIYQILTRIAGIAAQREIQELEGNNRDCEK